MGCSGMVTDRVTGCKTMTMLEGYEAMYWAGFLLPQNILVAHTAFGCLLLTVRTAPDERTGQEEGPRHSRNRAGMGVGSGRL